MLDMRILDRDKLKTGLIIGNCCTADNIYGEYIFICIEIALRNLLLLITKIPPFFEYFKPNRIDQLLKKCSIFL